MTHAALERYSTWRCPYDALDGVVWHGEAGEVGEGKVFPRGWRALIDTWKLTRAAKHLRTVSRQLAHGYATLSHVRLSQMENLLADRRSELD